MFGGPRDSEWTHIRVVGDRAAAAKYVPLARVLLGAAKAAVKTGVIKLSVLRRRLNNGVEIYAEMAGGIPRVVINVPSPPAREDEDVKLDGFVVWPINQANPDGPFAEGEAATHPQYVLSPPTRKHAQREWWVFAYERFRDFFAAIKARKSIYKETQDRRPVIPNGLRFYGNKYWRGDNGVAVSWHGSVSGAHSQGETSAVAAADGTVYSVVQAYAFKYAELVYHFGEVLLDLLDFPGYEAGTYVAAAAVVETSSGQWWLYVLEFTVRPFAAWPFQSNPAEDTKYALVRYPLKRGEARVGYDKAEVDFDRNPNREVLWTREWESVVDPSPPGRTRAASFQHAEFSPDGRKLVLHTTAYVTLFKVPNLFTGGFDDIGYNYNTYDRVIEVSLPEGSSTERVVRISAAAKRDRAPVFYGYDRSSTLRTIDVEQDTDVSAPFPVPGAEVATYIIGNTRIPACVWGATVLRRELMYADPGGQRLLLQRVDATLNESDGPVGIGADLVYTVELWGAEGLIRSWPGGARPKLNGVDSVGYLLKDDFYLYAAGVARGRAPLGNGIEPPEIPGYTYYADDALFSPSAVFTVVTDSGIVQAARIGPHAHQSYIPFKDDGPGNLRYSDNVVLLGGSVVAFNMSDGGFHGRRVYGLGFPPVLSYVRFGEYTLLSCYKPGVPDESIVDIIPNGDAAALTGFDATWLRLHPATVLGAPIFKTE